MYCRSGYTSYRITDIGSISSDQYNVLLQKSFSVEQLRLLTTIWTGLLFRESDSKQWYHKKDYNPQAVLWSEYIDVVKKGLAYATRHGGDFEE